ncbi:hypothetical protein Q9L42_002405 [Methylomarinum sp. Ch1-1]|uniref:Nucleotidyltransferase n=1 Tax=Methylomarinum roseum TaxID=3067653 RepID=A0AAU7NVC7_9GAMM|nr:hypothetical protein [Methylomarinum sp. Ch1-1]MDP4522974.1 hypothetical protein [Methylomarinum sp. Ch1-1]
MEPISARLLWDIFKHVRAWLANLHRAGDKRKQQSIRALRDIICASRETAVYMRYIDENNARDLKMESHLTLLWTELGFALEDLGIRKLAKRCQIQGKQWSDPAHYDEDFINKADISLDRMERLAKEILREIKR